MKNFFERLKFVFEKTHHELPDHNIQFHIKL